MADLAAMGEALQLLVGGGEHGHALVFGLAAAQAAQALRPLAGQHAFVLFSLGIIFTGMLAVPVLAGSAAYAVAEVMGWRGSLDLRPNEARGFYAIMIGATLAGTLIDFTPIDPIKALFYSAVVNGVVAVPIMAMLVLLASRRAALGSLRLRGPVRALAWIATAVMLAAVLFMVAAIWRA
jgi:Mn2+/Fe2+ NRAMP family transporter